MTQIEIIRCCLEDLLSCNSQLFKETLVLQEYTDIASTISLSVSGLDRSRHPNK